MPKNLPSKKPELIGEVVFVDCKEYTSKGKFCKSRKKRANVIFFLRGMGKRCSVSQSRPQGRTIWLEKEQKEVWLGCAHMASVKFYFSFRDAHFK